MEHLLADKHWTFTDVEINLNVPWIMVDRDAQGWLTPTRVLPYGNNENLHLYRGINGAQINNLTGEITFFSPLGALDILCIRKCCHSLTCRKCLKKTLQKALLV